MRETNHFGPSAKRLRIPAFLGVITLLPGAASAMVIGDLDGDTDVDTDDINIILAFRGQSATDNPPADLDGDGTITVLDARIAAVDCTRLLCSNVNIPPVITSDGGDATAAVSVPEGQTAVTDVQSTDAEGETEGAGLAYSLTGGADQALFSIDPGTGILTFGSAPDFEIPADANTDNVYEVQVTVTDSAGGSDLQDISVTVTNVNDPPVVTGETYDTIGNTLLEVSAAASQSPAVFVNGNALSNDTDGGDGPGPLAVSTTGTFTSTGGGLVTMNADGTFTYVPPAGASSGSDTFGYGVTDDGGTTTVMGTVTVKIQQIVWYVKNNAAAGGSGRSSDPFDTLLKAQTASAVGDTIFVHRGDGSTTGQATGVTLKNTQRLIGEGVALTFDGLTLNPAGSAPLITNSAGVGINVSSTSGVQIRGLQVTNTSGAGISGRNTADLTVDTVTVSNTVGHNIGLVDASGAITVSNNNLLDANEDDASDFLDENNGIDIANTSGTLSDLTVSNNTITGAMGGTTSDVAVGLHLDDTAQLTAATITQNSFSGHDFHAIRVALDNNDSGDAPVVGSLDISNNPLLSAEGSAVELVARGASSLTFSLSNNAQITSNFGTGINVNAGIFSAGVTSTATVTGSILNNLITNVGDAANDRGIDVLSQESTAVVVNIDGNTISNVANGGIALRVRDGSDLDAVVNNNTLTNTDTFGSSVLGLFAETRETSNGCFVITNNTNSLTFVLSQSAGTVFRLEPMTGNTGTVSTTGTITNVPSGTCVRVP